MHPDLRKLNPFQKNFFVIDFIKKLKVRFKAIVVAAGGWTEGSIKD